MSSIIFKITPQNSVLGQLFTALTSFLLPVSSSSTSTVYKGITDPTQVCKAPHYGDMVFYFWVIYLLPNSLGQISKLNVSNLISAFFLIVLILFIYSNIVSFLLSNKSMFSLVIKCKTFCHPDLLLLIFHLSCFLLTV